MHLKSENYDYTTWIGQRKIFFRTIFILVLWTLGSLWSRQFGKGHSKISWRPFDDRNDLHSGLFHNHYHPRTVLLSIQSSYRRTIACFWQIFLGLFTKQLFVPVIFLKMWRQHILKQTAKFRTTAKAVDFWLHTAESDFQNLDESNEIGS
jgi:hypothetical protein